jgi:hypothetical protein
MPRPHEPHADAIRTAREIVDDEGSTFAAAARSGDQAAIDAARQDLVARIAQAIVDAEQAASEGPADELS